MELNNLRNQIDSIDAELVALFQKRMALCADIANYKKDHDLPIFVPNREETVLSRVAGIADNEFTSYVQELYARIMELSKQYQQAVINKEVK